MFAGKTQLLLERLAAAEGLGKRVLAVKPIVDSRWPDEIVSHSGDRRSAAVARDGLELLGFADAYEVVGIDEAQFFEGEFAAAVGMLRQSTKVVVAALDLDFRGEPFGVVPALVEEADVVHRLTATCGVCGGRATLTQRILDGVPAPLEDEVVRVGGIELYSPRCASCYAWERDAIRAQTA
jgi:thymidine kinase